MKDEDENFTVSDKHFPLLNLNKNVAVPPLSISDVLKQTTAGGESVSSPKLVTTQSQMSETTSITSLTESTLLLLQNNSTIGGIIYCCLL